MRIERNIGKSWIRKIDLSEFSEEKVTKTELFMIK